MIYTKELLLRCINRIDGELHKRITNQWVGIPQALNDIALTVLKQLMVGNSCSGTYPQITTYYACIYVITTAAWQLEQQGRLTFGQVDEFDEQALAYERHLFEHLKTPNVAD